MISGCQTRGESLMDRKKVFPIFTDSFCYRTSFVPLSWLTKSILDEKSQRCGCYR